MSKFKGLNLKKLWRMSGRTESSGNGPSLFCSKRFNCVKMLLPKSTSFFLFGVSNVDKGENAGFGANRFKRRS